MPPPEVVLPHSRISELQSGRLGAILVLPDFFIDRIVRVPSPQKLAASLTKKARSGGGSVHGISQTEIKGGNAVNVAHALARLNAHVRLLTITDELGSKILEQVFAGFENVTITRISGRPGLTTALEFRSRGRHVNVMLSDLGDLGGLSWETIEADVKQGLEGAVFAVVVNWAALHQHGNEIVHSVFAEARQRHVKTFLDPADIAVRRQDFESLMNQTLLEGLVDVLSVNENETRIVCRSLGVRSLPSTYDEHELGAACRTISRKCRSTVDVHTPFGSATSDGEETEFVPAFPVETHVGTGAGDVWDAGDIMGHMLGLSARSRLTFANACAALYLASREVVAPALGQVRAFLADRGLLANS